VHEISGFWAWLASVGRDVDVRALGERVGGLRALVEGGLDALIAAGVPVERARAWAGFAATDTRGRAVTLLDDEYPQRLREVAGAPPVLFVEGDLEALSGPAVGVVGTRACTAYGAAVARHLGTALTGVGVCVVSGLARGVDGHAHRAALEGGRTIAVVAHGLATTAPSFHRPLRERIVAEGGLVVSGWLDDVRPTTFTFPQRNAWISGLSDSVVVVEAPARSGALITARCAATQGRDVYAVPGPVGAVASRGCLDLLADGAGVVVDVEAFAASRVGGRAPSHEDWLVRLFAGQTVDEVARFARRPTSQILAELSARELRGEVVRLPGQRYAPRGRPP